MRCFEDIRINNLSVKSSGRKAVTWIYRASELSRGFNTSLSCRAYTSIFCCVNESKSS